MIGLLKLIPLLVFAGGVAANGPQIKQKLNKLLNYTKTVGVQTEVNQISKMIYIDSLEDISLDPSNFGEYLRANMKTKKNISRDTSIDLFGTPYRYETDDDGFTVTSAGVDKQFDTDDDIYSGYDT